MNDVQFAELIRLRNSKEVKDQETLEGKLVQHARELLDYAEREIDLRDQLNKCVEREATRASERLKAARSVAAQLDELDMLVPPNITSLADLDSKLTLLKELIERIPAAASPRPIPSEEAASPNLTGGAEPPPATNLHPQGVPERTSER